MNIKEILFRFPLSDFDIDFKQYNSNDLIMILNILNEYKERSKIVTIIDNNKSDIESDDDKFDYIIKLIKNKENKRAYEYIIDKITKSNKDFYDIINYFNDNQDIDFFYIIINTILKNFSKSKLCNKYLNLKTEHMNSIFQSISPKASVKIEGNICNINDHSNVTPILTSLKYLTQVRILKFYSININI